MNIKVKIKLVIIAVLFSILQIHVGFDTWFRYAFAGFDTLFQSYSTQASTDATQPKGFADESDTSAPLLELFERFQTQEARCDFVIVLDTSGSMTKDGLFGRVTQAVSIFISILQPGDYLSLVAFDNYPRYLLIPQEIFDDTEKLKQAILQLPEPKGQKTDIGAALEKTLDELNRPHANKLQFVFFITDGKHEPTANSKYPTLTHKNWELLLKKADRTLNDNSIAVTGLGLNHYTDISLLRKVFPQAVPLTVDENGLISFFNRLKAELKVRKLRMQVIDELKRGKIFLVPESSCKGRLKEGGTASVKFKLKSDYEHISIAVVIEAVSILGDNRLECSVEQMGQVFYLEPQSESPTLTLKLSDRRRKRRFAWRKVERKKVQVVFELALRPQPQKGLLKLNLNPEFKQVILGAE